LTPPDYQTGNYGDKTDSVLAKANPNFLDNLNAKLAEQHATNKANAVRSYINSKVVVSRFEFYPFHLEHQSLISCF
jgi:hypothetical protein